MICDHCGTAYQPRVGRQRFCSPKCRYAEDGNTEKRIAQKKARRQRQLKFIRRVKKFYGCSECGYKAHHSALQFDHLVPEDKSFELSKGHLRSMSQIKLEIKKCRILCANCHSIHTHNQQEARYAKCTGL